LITDYRTWWILQTWTAHSTSRGVLLSWIKPCAISVLRVLESALSLLQLQTLNLRTSTWGSRSRSRCLLSFSPGAAVWGAAARGLCFFWHPDTCYSTSWTTLYVVIYVLYVHNRRRQKSERLYCTPRGGCHRRGNKLSIK
jgi:hypothetical protein